MSRKVAQIASEKRKKQKIVEQSIHEEPEEKPRVTIKVDLFHNKKGEVEFINHEENGSKYIEWKDITQVKRAIQLRMRRLTSEYSKELRENSREESLKNGQRDTGHE